jgi:hypothetical protein
VPEPIDSLFALTRAVTARVKNGRKPADIMMSIMSEVGETAEEVQIAYGVSYKTEGPDGVVGEAVDAIICLLDLIMVHNPEITEKHLLQIASLKLAKWEAKARKLP